MYRSIAIVAFALSTTTALAQTAPGGAEPKPAPPAPPAAPETGKGQQPETPGKLSAKDILKACADRYGKLKTYRDEGNVHTDMAVPGMPPIKTDAPFSTAFERDGRFLWEFRHSASPGHKPDQQYVVWSKDHKTFNSHWTLTKEKSKQDSIDQAMAGPTGISGGSATVIVPLLHPNMQLAYTTTSVINPTITGTEKVDGTDCTMIAGKYPDIAGSKPIVTLWIDSAMAIRKMVETKTIDPKKLGAGPGMDGPAFTSTTTITIKPVLDGKIEDRAFDPPAAAAK